MYLVYGIDIPLVPLVLRLFLLYWLLNIVTYVSCVSWLRGGGHWFLQKIWPNFAGTLWTSATRHSKVDQTVQLAVTYHGLLLPAKLRFLQFSYWELALCLLVKPSFLFTKHACPVHDEWLLSLSILTAIFFPGEPRLAGSIEAKDDGSGGDNWSYKTCKAAVKSSPPTNQHPMFYGPDALPVAQPTVSEHWRKLMSDFLWGIFSKQKKAKQRLSVSCWFVFCYCTASWCQSVQSSVV